MKTLKLLPLLATLGWAAFEPSMAAAAESQTLRLMIGANLAGQASREKPASDRQEVERLMVQARAALKEGNYETADSLIQRAEKLNVEFSMFRLGDTPKKLRADYKSATRNRKDAPARPSKQFTPEMPAEKVAESPADKSLEKAAAKTAAAPRGPAPVQVPQEQKPGDDAPLPLPDSGGKLSQNPFFQKTPSPEKEEQAQPTQLPPPDHEHPVAPPANPANVAQRRESDAQLLTARRALAEGDVRRATALVETARKANIRYGYHDDTPDKVSAAIERYRQVMTAINGREDEASRHQLAEVLMEQAQQLLRWRDFAEAERLVQTVQSMRVNYGPFEAKPQALLEKIAAARKQAAGPTHVTVEEDGTPTAEATAQVEPPAKTPATQNPPKKSAPAAAAQAVYNQPADKGRVTRASAQEEVISSDGDDAAASDEQLPAPPEQLDAGSPVTTPAMQFFRRGEQALKEQDTARALEYFRRAHAGRDHLDESTARRLQDHLQMLSAPAPGKRPAPKGESLTESTNANKVLDAKKLSAEVAQKQVAANKLREKEPKRSLEILKETRALIEASTVETADRAILLRRVDRNIAELDKYISANRAQIELDTANKEVLKDVERRQSGKIEVDEKLAKLVDEFQDLMDQQRYAEAEVLAKRARELDPDNPVVRQMFWTNRLVKNTERNRSLIEAKEKGVINTLDSVEWAAVPEDDRDPYKFPDAKKWNELTGDRRKRFAENRSRRTESELEIERKLKTPVMLKFQDRPLSEVLEHLAKLASVNLHLDQKGLDEEGVTSDRTVTINLTNEIQLKSALKLILEPLHLSYVIKDEVLKITSEQLRDGEVYFQTYNVADLVMPIPNFSPNARMGLSSALADAYAVAGQGGMNGFGAGTTYLASHDGAPATGMMSQNIMAQVNQAMPGRGGPGGGVPFGPGGMGGGSQASFEELIDLITTTVKPQTWEEVGGPGSIQEFKNNLSLVISQTQEVHEEIVDLLEQLRANQDLQVTIEVRFITLNDNFFERIGVDFQFNINNNAPRDPNSTGNKREIVGLDPPVSGGSGIGGGGFPNYTVSNNLDLQFRQTDFNLAVPQFGQPTEIATFGFAILSDLEAFLLVSAAQGDRRSNVLQAPKVTMFNGQTASVSDFTQQPFVIGVIPVVGDFAAAYQPVITVLSQGTYLSVQATISNDRRFVRLTVLPFFSQIGDVQEFTFSGQKTTTKNTSSSDSKGSSGESNSDSDNQTTSTDGITIQLPNFSVVSVNTTVSVPDGGTVLLGGIKRLSEGRNEFGVPILSKLPYINRLFKNVGIGRETQSLMMMVTPRIIIQQEEEERLGIQTPP